MAHFGVFLPQINSSWQEIKSVALACDRLGYDSVWVCDHLHGLPRFELPLYEAWSTIAALAAVTERVQIGSAVTPPFVRNAAVLAKQIATIARISDGRVVPGLGAGWLGEEFAAYGCDFPPIGERLRALEETCEIFRRLWTEPLATYEGRHYAVRGAVCEPKPEERPPLMIGGGGERVLMRIAARYADIWNNQPFEQNRLAGKIEALRRRCDEQGRDFGSLRVSQEGVVVLAETDEEARQLVPKAKRALGGQAGPGYEEHGICTCRTRDERRRDSRLWRRRLRGAVAEGNAAAPLPHP